MLADDDADRSPEDRPAPAAGASGPQNRPLLGVRGRGALAPRGRLRAHRPLAGLHLVRHRQRRAPLPSEQDRMVGRAGEGHAPTVQ